METPTINNLAVSCRVYWFGRQFSRNLVWLSLVIVSLVLLVRLNHLPIIWSLCRPDLILPTLLTNTLPPTRPDQNTHQLWIKLQFGFLCWKCNWFQSTSKSGINLCIHNTWFSTGSYNKTKIQGTFSDAVTPLFSVIFMAMFPSSLSCRAGNSIPST